MLPPAYAPLHRNSLKMSLWLSSWHGKPSIHPARLELSSLPSRCHQDRGLPPVQDGKAKAQRTSMPRSLPSLHCADLIVVGHTARWNESSALQISSSSSAAGAGADRGAHGAARSVSPSTGQVRVTKEILDQKRRELLNLKKRASEPTALLSNASPTSFYTSGSPPLSTPPSRSSPVPGSGSPPPSLTPAGKPKSPPHVLPLVPPTGHLRGEEQLRRALADMEARLLMAKSEVLKEREAGTSARARLKVSAHFTYLVIHTQSSDA